MKKMRTLVLSMLLLVLFCSCAYASKLDFTLVNNTGYRIDIVNVTPATSDSWEEDIMGKDYLENGQSVSIHFPAKADSKLWDLQIVYTNGENFFWYDLDLTTVSTVTLSTKKDGTFAYLDNGKAYSAKKTKR